MSVLQYLNQIQYRRGMVYSQGIIYLFSIPFLFICLQVIIRFQKLAEQGNIVFLFYTFYDLFIFIGFLLITLGYGAKANEAD